MSVEAHNDAKKFALSVVSSTPAKGDSPEAIAKEKIELYNACINEFTKNSQNGRNESAKVYMKS